MDTTRERIPRPNPEVMRVTDQPRIRFASVRRACLHNGMRLQAQTYLDQGDDGRPSNCGCPLAVLYVARYGYPVALDESGTKWEPETECVESWGIGRYGLSYLTGFMAGFDYTASPNVGCHDTTQRSNLFTAGYRDGAAVYHRAERADLLAA